MVADIRDGVTSDQTAAGLSGGLSAAEAIEFVSANPSAIAQPRAKHIVERRDVWSRVARTGAVTIITLLVTGVAVGV
jgi:hypothetical protein